MSMELYLVSEPLCSSSWEHHSDYFDGNLLPQFKSPLDLNSMNTSCCKLSDLLYVKSPITDLHRHWNWSFMALATATVSLIGLFNMFIFSNRLLNPWAYVCFIYHFTPISTEFEKHSVLLEKAHYIISLLVLK